MKGILFNILSDLDEAVMWKAMRSRVFGPLLNIPGEDNNASGWTAQMVGTFADLATIEAGDKVFFFKNKTLYGIGEVISPADREESPLLQNAPGALRPEPIDGTSPDGEESSSSSSGASNGSALYTGDDWQKVRAVVPFRGSPAFFKQGIDMDHLLGSNRLQRAPYLEFFESKNFSLLTEEETRTLAQLLWTVNRDTDDVVEPPNALDEFETSIRTRSPEEFSVRSHVEANREVLLEDDEFSKENWAHGLALEALKKSDEEVLPSALAERERRHVFREFPTSPAKPSVWANHLDILAERQPSPSTDGGDAIVTDGTDTTVGYEVIEVKKEEVRYIDDLVGYLGQLMKYVDHVAEELADGHYDAIDAYLLTGGYSESDDTYRERVLQEFENRPMTPAEAEDTSTELPATYREYVASHRPFDPELQLWNRVSLLEYGWNEQTDSVEIRDVTESF
jgi:hypothetical protein